MMNVRMYGYAVLTLLLSVMLPACTAQVAESPAPAAVPTETAMPSVALPTPAMPPIPNAMGLFFPSPVPDPTTTVVTYRPPMILPEQEGAAGRCWTTSLMVNSWGAWRCAAGNALLDPCFASEGDLLTVRCVTNPGGPAPVTKMRLTEPLPANDDRPKSSTGSTYAFVLADGVSCLFTAGATSIFEGERLNYVCSDGWVVFGQPTPGSLWTVTKTKLKSDKTLEQTLPAQIATVWR